jgi:hypothetical protein
MDSPFSDSHALPDDSFIGESDVLHSAQPTRGHHNRIQITKDIRAWRALGEMSSHLYLTRLIERALAKIAEQRYTLCAFHR